MARWKVNRDCTQLGGGMLSPTSGGVLRQHPLASPGGGARNAVLGVLTYRCVMTRHWGNPMHGQVGRATYDNAEAGAR